MTHTLDVDLSLPVSLKTSLELQTVPGDEQKTPKMSTFQQSDFFRNLMKKREEENKQKEEHTMTVQEEVHRDTPGC